MALTSPVPDSVVRLPATVLREIAPALTTSSCAASVCTEPVVLPVSCTRLTVTAAVWPSVKAVASLRYSPPLPTPALSRATSVSMALAPAPTAAPLPAALSRSSLAYTLTAVSDVLSSTLPLLLRTLTEPQGVPASDCLLRLEPVRSAAVRASSTPSVMLPPAATRIVLPVVCSTVPPFITIVLAAPVACTSSVPPAVLRSPAAV